MVILILFVSPAFAAETAAPEPSEGRAPRTRRQAGLDVPEGIVITETARPKPPGPPPPPRWVNRRDIKPHVKAPIWKSFYKHFTACAPGCEPGRIGTHGQRANATCHTGGEAIDIHGIKCNGVLYPAEKRGRFEKFVNCMKPKMKWIYWSARHYDHAHFSNGCKRGGRRMY